MKKTVSLLLCVVLFIGALIGCTPKTKAAAPAEPTSAEKKDLRIAVISLVVHPWFYEVYLGSQAQAEKMSAELGYKIQLDYYAPEHVEVSEQIALIEQVAATNPDGIIICPVEVTALTPLIEDLQSRGVAIGLINQQSEWPGVVGCANSFTDQGKAVGKLIVESTGGKGKVAVMNGTTLSSHAARYQGIMDYLKDYPELEIVEAGYGMDTFTTSAELAQATVAANPDLICFACVDATAPTAIANAVREANKVKDITVIGMETTDEILEAISDGTIKATVTSKADLQGRALLLNVWAMIKGMEPCHFIDTGLDTITLENVDQFKKK